MTRIQKLDRILMSLLAYDLYQLKNPDKKICVDLNFINVSQLDSSLEVWEMTTLQEELFHDGYVIIHSADCLKITELGKKFIKKGGYKKQESSLKKEEIIQNKTIEKFKFDKWSFFLSVVAILISIITLIFTIFKS